MYKTYLPVLREKVVALVFCIDVSDGSLCLTVLSAVNVSCCSQQLVQHAQIDCMFTCSTAIVKVRDPKYS